MKILTVLIILLLLCVGIVWMAKLQWQRYTTLQFQKLEYHISSPSSTHPEEINTLPPIVQKYFHLVLRDGSPLIRQVHLSQIGGFRAKPEMKSWSAMRAKQQFTTSPRGFIWSAEISMLPGVPISICDSYIKGEGAMKGKLLSLVPIIDTSNKEELNKAALQRYLAEAVWFPTALLPSQGVSWKAIDGYRAEATLTDHDITVTLEYTFNEKGEILSIYTPNRYREVNGKYISTPWRARVSNYIEVDGYLVPSYGEVEWILRDHIYTYWRSKIVDIHFND